TTIPAPSRADGRFHSARSTAPRLFALPARPWSRSWPTISTFVFCALSARPSDVPIRPVPTIVMRPNVRPPLDLHVPVVTIQHPAQVVRTGFVVSGDELDDPRTAASVLGRPRAESGVMGRDVERSSPGRCIRPREPPG